MINFPFNEISGLTMKLHNLQEEEDLVKGHYVYAVHIYPNRCSFEVHMNEQMFKDVLSTYLVGSFGVQKSILSDSVHLSTTVDGSITLICCVLRDEMLLTADDKDKSTKQLFKEWAERTGWPYV